MRAAETLRVLVGMPLASMAGGAERLLATMMRHAEAADLRAHVVFLEEGPLVDAVAACGAATTVIRVDDHRDPVVALRTVARLRTLLARDDPQLVLSWMPRAHVYLAPANALTRPRRPVVWWQHHIARGERLERVASLTPATGVVATSHAAAAAQAAAWPHRTCRVVHPGIELPSATNAERLEELRTELGLAPDRPVIGIAARMVRWKGQDRFLESIEQLVEEGHDVAALVIGGTAYGLEPHFATELEARARRGALAGRVVFSGHVADPIPFLQLMDVLVSATDREPFGMTLLEGMSLGVPVVAVESGGPAEIVEDGRSGVLVPDGRPASLAGGVKRLLTDSRLRERVTAEGRRRVEASFGARRMAHEAATALRAFMPNGARS